MITGYNTDIEHEGVVYHVQTEDKGLDSPIVLSLVYTGGAILAAKRSSYADLIAGGFEEAALAERLKRQHRLICAAIHAGRIEELKQLSKGQTGKLVAEHAALMESTAAAPADEPASAAPVIEQEETADASFADASFEQTLPQASAVPPRTDRATGALTFSNLQPEQLVEPGPGGPSPYTVYDARRRSRLGDLVEEPDGLRITLLEHDPHFNGGENIELKALVTKIESNREAPLSGATVSIKILGTTFRPVLLSAKTDRDGVMSVATRIPAFTSGRAAIVVKATASDLASEARWVVHPGK